MNWSTLSVAVLILVAGFPLWCNAAAGDVGMEPLLLNGTAKWKRANKEVYLIISDTAGKQTRHLIRKKDEDYFCTLPTLWQTAATVDSVTQGKKIGKMESLGDVYNSRVLTELAGRTQPMVRGVYRLRMSRQNMVIVRMHDHVLVTWRERDGHRKDKTGVAWIRCVPRRGAGANATSIADGGSNCNWNRTLGSPKQVGVSSQIMLNTKSKEANKSLYGEDMRLLRRNDGSLVANWCVNNVVGQHIRFFYAPVHVHHTPVHGDTSSDSAINTLSVEAPIHRITMDREMPPSDQKNWPMFEYANTTLLFLQSIQPLRVIIPAEAHALSPLIPKGKKALHVVDYGHSVSLSEATNFCWPWGAVRGGTPLQLINGEYLGFFHTKTTLSSRLVSTYVIGAYTMTAHPPFKLKAMSKMPLVPKDLLGGNWTYPRMDFVFFPMAFEFDRQEGTVHVSMGRNEREGWVVSFDYALLKANMRALKTRVLASSQWVEGAPIFDTFEFKE
jgi:hypothetical protein